VWERISLGPDGRAVAANLPLSDGAVLRVMGLYGPTGGSHPGFSAQALELRLTDFARAQVALCDAHGWHLAALGSVDLSGP